MRWKFNYNNALDKKRPKKNLTSNNVPVVFSFNCSKAMRIEDYSQLQKVVENNTAVRKGFNQHRSSLA